MKGFNWRYLLIVFVLAVFTGIVSVWIVEKEEFLIIDDLKIRNEEKNSDKELILEKIEQGKEFLLRMEHPELHGFYKKYDAPTDSFEKRLHTVYSASIIYTLLKAYDFEEDERIWQGMSNWGQFLLSMQSQEEETRGAFYYSYYFEEEEKEQRFVVGTAALSIFTLLDLYQKTDDKEYLESAKLAGDWLLSMQKDDGVMMAEKKYKKGEWDYVEKESLLYNGQVLSALSRLYKETGNKKYHEAALKITNYFIGRVAEGGCYLGDDYRAENPISSAWVIMSLLDFYKINPNEYYKGIILNCSRYLSKRQITDADDPLYFGRWSMAFSTSGNGWLAEVMMEMYKFCREEKGTECNNYKEAVVNVIKWLIGNTYSEENSQSLKNPERAIGGIFWNSDEKYVRTDSVCHALNAYIGIVDEL